MNDTQRLYFEMVWLHCCLLGPICPGVSEGADYGLAMLKAALAKGMSAEG